MCITTLKPKKRLAKRLRALLEPEPKTLERIARYGCPLGSLCQEWGKQGGSLASQIAQILDEFLKWCEEQFKALGCGKRASDLALNLVSHLQGIYLFMHTFKDIKIFEEQKKLLEQWLGNVSAEARVKEHTMSEPA
jgi:TetR/AcrR family transcriptional regulator, transcriptional repressor for nem operon